MKTAKVNNAIVIEHETLPTRWLDIFGECAKWELPVGSGVDTNSNIVGFTHTLVSDGAGTSTVVNSSTYGERVLITTAAGDYDGTNSQVLGEPVKLVSDKPLYFGVKLKINDVDQTDLLVGLAETDTALLAVDTAHAVDYGTSDVIGFLSLDEAATIATQTVNAGVVVGSATASDSLTDATYVTLEMYFDGTILHYYMDGEEVTNISGSLPDGDLTPTINFRTGEGTANTCKIAWMRCFQAL